MLLIDLKNTFFKQINNSVCGKTVENLGRQVKLRLVIDVKGQKKMCEQVNFVLQKIFSRNFVAIYEIKLILTLDKLIYVGFSILDLSKL